MNIKKMPVILLAASLWGCTTRAPAASAADLSKADATRLLTFMGKRNIVVAAVVNGFGGMGASSPNVAMVLGYREDEQGRPEEIREAFFCDKDLGWFQFHIDLVRRRVRIFTTTGYKDLKPAPNQ